MEITPNNLIPIMDIVFEKYKIIKNTDVILSVGASKTGQSTLLNSLMYGSDVLESRELEFQLKESDYSVKKCVIDTIPQTGNIFQIHHSA